MLTWNTDIGNAACFAIENKCISALETSTTSKCWKWHIQSKIVGAKEIDENTLPTGKKELECWLETWENSENELKSKSQDGVKM